MEILETPKPDDNADALIRIAQTYCAIFDAIMADNEKFNVHEIESARVIRTKSLFGPGSKNVHCFRPIPLNNSDVGFGFSHDVTILNTAPEIFPFIAAHEFKHASLYYNASLGRRNILTLENQATDAAAKGRITRRIEEICDASALKVSPNPSWPKLYDFMQQAEDAYQSYAKEYEFTAAEICIYRPHPTPDDRIARLKKQQNTMRHP